MLLSCLDIWVFPTHKLQGIHCLVYGLFYLFNICCSVQTLFQSGASDRRVTLSLLQNFLNDVNYAWLTLSNHFPTSNHFSRFFSFQEMTMAIRATKLSIFSVSFLAFSFSLISVFLLNSSRTHKFEVIERD